MNVSSINKGIIQTLRWLVSIAFFFLAIRKIELLLEHGLHPYMVLIETAGLPFLFSYYGVIAVFVELATAIGVWRERIFKLSIAMCGILTLLGTVISIGMIAFKASSDCGCGLLGDNETGLLIQKLVILALLITLYRSKSFLFSVKQA